MFVRTVTEGNDYLTLPEKSLYAGMGGSPNKQKDTATAVFLFSPKLLTSS
jgi:hypothetical protein